MVLTILEARVAKDQWEPLRATFAARTAHIPEGIRQTMLVQARDDPETWRVVTHWRSLQDLDAMRSSDEVPLAVQIFRHVGATPQLSAWNIVVWQERGDETAHPG